MRRAEKEEEEEFAAMATEWLKSNKSTGYCISRDQSP
jgi:hypothetical protein